ncbi:hypothetical protein SARC_00319 [Sphaeroforma arctica JP610]|uniref:Uncharacterized protein n=1 Tax=Sphaeroforma arctica JP610 TaxID=667725 RepID=A0A0L0GFB7_9EUKA|nr:hypothetical protein SARC_00319 [Sphaeroforma arctica JP610]KNC87554.1 hypothetical protein SARC_00319 [Sphaeroforma arctica JP610]|eukprot:XP_014161456.1 hypothetical protein SARC_00319 [Sphaeroforma arctica JP610]
MYGNPIPIGAMPTNDGYAHNDHDEESQTTMSSHANSTHSVMSDQEPPARSYKPRPPSNNPNLQTTKGYLIPGQSESDESFTHSDLHSETNDEENPDGYLDEYDGYQTDKPLNHHTVDDYGRGTLNDKTGSPHESYKSRNSHNSTPRSLKNGSGVSVPRGAPEDLNTTGAAQRGFAQPNKQPHDLDVHGMQQPRTDNESEHSDNEDDDDDDGSSVYSGSSNDSEPTFGYMNEFGQLVYITDPEQQRQLAQLASEQGDSTQVMYIDEGQYKQLRDMRGNNDSQ